MDVIVGRRHFVHALTLAGPGRVVGVVETPDEYWNHNTAYHPWLVDIATRHNGDVLDVGGGDGLLAQRMSPVSRSVTAIEPDPSAVQRASERLADHPGVAVVETDFERYQPNGQRFDLITFVASLHHMDLRPTLSRARDMLTPTGEIAVVGLSANKSIPDWLWRRGVRARGVRGLTTASPGNPRYRRRGHRTARQPLRDPSHGRRGSARRVPEACAVLPLSPALDVEFCGRVVTAANSQPSRRSRCLSRRVNLTSRHDPAGMAFWAVLTLAVAGVIGAAPRKPSLAAAAVRLHPVAPAGRAGRRRQQGHGHHHLGGVRRRGQPLPERGVRGAGRSAGRIVHAGHRYRAGLLLPALHNPAPPTHRGGAAAGSSSPRCLRTTARSSGPSPRPCRRSLA